MTPNERKLLRAVVHALVAGGTNERTAALSSLLRTVEEDATRLLSKVDDELAAEAPADEAPAAAGGTTPAAAAGPRILTGGAALAAIGRGSEPLKPAEPTEPSGPVA